MSSSYKNNNRNVAKETNILIGIANLYLVVINMEKQDSAGANLFLQFYQIVLHHL